MKTSSAVAFIVFNRPDHTQASFARIRAAQPSRLFIIADGPRDSHPRDEQLCAAVRQIVQEVDWTCDVKRNYAPVNMGLKNRVSTGLDWVFSQVDRAIILEDDCVAHPDFFSFCDEMLNRYAEEAFVKVITGNNFQRGQTRGEGSYYFSKYPHCWGWATWKRAWDLYDGGLTFWSGWRESEAWQASMPDRTERRYWEKIFDRVEQGLIDSWAYPWTASVWYQQGFTVTPNSNLVTNIGFDDAATHTKTAPHGHQVKTAGIEFPLKHPTETRRDLAADRFTFKTVFDGDALRSRRHPVGFVLWLVPRLVRTIGRKMRFLKTETRNPNSN